MRLRHIIMCTNFTLEVSTRELYKYQWLLSLYCSDHIIVIFSIYILLFNTNTKRLTYSYYKYIIIYKYNNFILLTKQGNHLLATSPSTTPCGLAPLKAPAQPTPSLSSPFTFKPQTLLYHTGVFSSKHTMCVCIFPYKFGTC